MKKQHVLRALQLSKQSLERLLSEPVLSEGPGRVLAQAAQFRLEQMEKLLTEAGDGSDNYHTVGVDVGGVLAVGHGFQGHGVIGEPYPHAKRLLEELKRRELRVIVFSTHGQGEMHDWLVKHGLDHLVDEINVNTELLCNNHSKPVCNWYIDDRAVTFRGDVDDVLRQIDGWRDWWRT